MASSKWHYNRQMLVDAIIEAGIKSGDVVFSHIGIGYLGFPQEGKEPERVFDVLLEAFKDVLGYDGTWLVPTFSYSYCKNQIYDPDATPSDVGEFTNYFRRLPGVNRSLDPIFSVAGMGSRLNELIDGLPRNCFGSDSVYDRLIRAEAKICNVGVSFRVATFVHYVEQMMKAPYRYFKMFNGYTLKNGEFHGEGWIYNVRALCDNSKPNLERLEQMAHDDGCLKKVKIGRGIINCISCVDLKNLCIRGITQDPWFLANGPVIDINGLKPDEWGNSMEG